MGNGNTTLKASVGIPFETSSRLTRAFLNRHGGGLEDLLRRFPSVPGAHFRSSIERHLVSDGSAKELKIALEEACETLLWLREGDFHPLPVDAGRRLNVDAGIRWYAARFSDLAKTVEQM